MTQPDDRYKCAKLALDDQGCDVNDLEQFASLFLRLPEQEHDIVFAEFHNRSGRFPFIYDSDIGALILERIAEECNSVELKIRLYREASWRSTWCAGSATSGGEVLSRAQDVARLDAKTKAAEQCASS